MLCVIPGVESPKSDNETSDANLKKQQKTFQLRSNATTKPKVTMVTKAASTSSPTLQNSVKPPLTGSVTSLRSNSSSGGGGGVGAVGGAQTSILERG